MARKLNNVIKTSSANGEKKAPRKLKNVTVNDSAVYGIQKTAEDSYKKLQEYSNRRSNNEYISAAELAGYRKARTNYTSATRKLNDMTRATGGSVDAGRDKQIYDWLNTLDEDFDYAESIGNNFKSADEYGAAVRDVSYRDKYAGKSYSELQKDIVALQHKADTDKSLSDEIAWLKNYSSTDRGVIDAMTLDELDELKKKNAVRKSEMTDRQAYLTKLLTENRRKLERGHTVEGMSMAEIQAERRKLQNEEKNSDVLYYDNNGTAVTVDGLMAMKQRENELDAIRKDGYTSVAYEELMRRDNFDVDLGELSDFMWYTANGTGGVNAESILKETPEWKKYKALANANGLDLNKSVAEVTEDIKRAERYIEGYKERLEKAGYDWEKHKEYNKYVYDRNLYAAKYAEAEEYGRKHPLDATVTNIIASPFQAVDLVENLGENKTGLVNIYDDDIVNSISARQEGVTEKIDESIDNDVVSWLATTAYSGVTSSLQSAATAAASNFLFGPAAGPAISLGILGSQAAASSFNEAIKNGSTNGQALGTAILAGVAEAAFEKLPLDNLFAAAKGLDTSSVKKLIWSGIKQTGKQTIIEGLEEAGTNIVNTIADAIINGDHSGYNTTVEKLVREGYTREEAQQAAAVEWLKEFAGDFVGGMFGGMASGGSVNLGGVIANYGNARSNGRFTKAMGAMNKADTAAFEDLKSVAALMPDNTEVQKALKSVDKRDSNAHVGTLSRAVNTALLKEFSNAETIEELDGLKEKYGTNNSYVNEAYAREYKRVTGNSYIKPTITSKGTRVEATAKPTQDSYSGTVGNLVYKGITKDGTDVEVKGIDVVSGEIITDKGNFAAEDIAFADNATAALFENASKYKTPAVADLYVAAYNPDLKGVGIYNKAFEGIYEAAEIGKDFDYTWNTFKGYEALDMAAAKAIWQAGNDEYTANQSRIDAKLTKDATIAQTPTKKAKSKGEVRFRNGVTADTAEQKNAVKLAKQLAKIIGIDIEFFDSRVDKNVNGWFDRNTDTIHLDMQKAVDDRHTIAFTLSHELVHFIEKWSPAKYDTFAKFLLEKYAEKGMDLNAMLVRKQLELKANNGGKRVSVGEAYSELIADACEAMLLDSNATEVLAELASKDKDLVARIKRFFADILNKLRRAYKGLSPQSEEGKLMRKMASECEAIYRMFEDALADAVQSYQSAEVVEEAIKPTDSMVQFNRKVVDKHKTDIRNAYVKNAAVDVDALINRYDALLEIWDEIGGELNSEFLNEWNNKGQDHSFTVFKAQAGYKYNIELSSMCKKGVPLFEAIDRIVKSEVMSRLKSDKIGKAEKEILYDILKQHHFEIPCAICYVEQARQREGTIINAFLNGNENGKLGWNNVLSSVEDEMKAMGVDYTFPTVSRDISTDNYSAETLTMDEKTQKAFYSALMKLCNEEIERYNKETKDNKLKRKVRETLKGTTPADIKKSLSGTLPANLTLFKVLFTEPNSRFSIDRDLLYSSVTTLNLARRHHKLYSLFNSQGGTAGYKTKQTPITYVGDILKKKWAASKTREEGGIRNQSNSDFQMYTLLDQAQMYMDFTAKGYYLQAYTKVLAELKLFGLSRGKINASLIPAVHIFKDANGDIDVARTQENAGLDANGELIFDDIEGIPHEEAFMLLSDENYSKSIGGICIGYSYKHIDKLLNDPRVQLIIGFHDKTNDPDKRYRGARYAHNFNGENEATHKDTGKTEHIGFNQFVIRAEKMFKAGKNDTFTGAVEFNGKEYEANDIPKLAADIYLDYCEENNLNPAYERFSGHENYYKLLADFSLYDSKGNYAPHRKVAYDMPAEVPYLDKNGAKKYMPTKDYIKSELKAEMAVRDDLSEALSNTSENGIIPQFVKKANELYDEMNDVQYQGKKKGKYTDNDLKTEGVHWGYEIGVMTNVHARAVWEAIAKIQENRYNEDLMTEYGDYYVDADDLLMIVDANFVNPTVRTIFKFDDKYEDSMASAKGWLIDAKGNESEIQDALDLIKFVKGEGYVSVYSYEDSPTYARKNGRGKGKDSSGVVREVQKQLKSSDTDKQFQQKLPSDRTILANALESTIDEASNPKSADIIKRYKAQINTITEAEKELAEINGKIKELSFAKGNRDTNKLKFLHDEKARLTKKIDTFDKSLLRLEATSVLKDVLTREKAKVKAATNAKAKEKLNEVKQKERDRASAREEAIVNKFREANERGRENRNKTVVRNKIRKNIAELSKLFSRGTKEKNVKAGMQDTVATALASAQILFADDITNEMIARQGFSVRLTDTENKAAWEYMQILKEIDEYYDAIDTLKDSDEIGKDDKIRGYRDAIWQHKQKLKKLDKKLEEAFKSERERYYKASSSGILRELANAYAKIQNAAEDYLRTAYNDSIRVHIEQLADYLEEAEPIIRDMSLDTLEKVYRAYRMVLTSVRKANKTFLADKNATIASLGNATMDEVLEVGGENLTSLGGRVGEAADGLKSFSINNLKPVQFFKRIGSNTLTKLFNNVRKGEDVWAVDIEEAIAFKKSLDEIYDTESWDTDESYTFTSVLGDKFKVTLGQMMSLYAYSKRDKAMPHLEQGGFVHSDSITTYKDTEVVEKNGKTKTKKIVKYRINDASAYKITQETMDNIKAELEKIPGIIEYIDEMQAYLSKVMGAKGNEVSMEMYGVELFGENYYFPLKSAQQYLYEQNEVAGEVRLKNASFSKETVPFARNPVILDNFLDVWANHVNDMSMYHAFVLPLEDFNRVYNYNTRGDATSSDRSVKAIMQNAYGKQANEYISQLLKDLNGGARVDPREIVGNRLTSSFKKAKVYASLSVIIQQPSAIARALSEVDAKYFIGKKSSKSHKENWAEVKKYAPVAIIKEMGRFDVNMGRSTIDYIKGEKTWKDKVDEAISRPAAFMDEATWIHIWEAVKRETADKYPVLSGEALLTKAGERFTDVITKTQVYDSTLSRSANMRSKTWYMNALTAFMAEPTTAINMVENAIIDMKRGNVKTGIRTIGAVAASVVLNSMLVSLVYAARDDDEEKSYIEKYTSAFTSEIVDGLLPFGYIPLVKDVWSLLQGYDVERSDMSLIADFVTSLEKIVKLATKEDTEREEWIEAWHNAGYKAANLFGVPLDNLMRDGKAIVNVAKEIIDGINGNGKEFSLEDVGESAVGGVKDITPVWGWSPDKKTSAAAYYVNYIDDGKTKEAKSYLAELIADETAKKAEKDGITGELTPYQKHKYEEKAKTKVRGDITSELKPLYLAALKDKDNAATKRIRKIMAASQLYENIEETFIEWRREEVSEDFKNRYMEAWVAKDHKTMEKIAKEMVNTGLWKKPYATIKTWITNYEKGA